MADDDHTNAHNDEPAPPDAAPRLPEWPVGRRPTREETVALLRACHNSAERIAEWNRRRQNNDDWVPEVSAKNAGSDLTHLGLRVLGDNDSCHAVDLKHAHLEGAYLLRAHLEGADLSDAHLAGANLWHAHLEGANLAHAHVEGAYLVNAHLQDANLIGVHLEGANLRDAHLKGADIRHAHLKGATLENADLEGADISYAALEGANLENANLKRARLIRVGLEGSNLMGAHLEGAQFTHAHLNGAKLIRLNLEGAILMDASLEGAYLEGAHLKGANLTRANLKDVDLKGAHLEGANLSSAKFGGFPPAPRLAALGRRIFRSAVAWLPRLRAEVVAMAQRRSKHDALRTLRNQHKATIPTILCESDQGTFHPLTNFEDADLRRTEGLILNGQNIRGARFDPFHKEPYSIVRRHYTGPLMLFNLLFLLAFLTPYVARAVVWRAVGEGERTAADWLRRAGEAGAINPAAVAAALERAPLTAESIPLWKLILGADKGWWYAALALVLIGYNALRAVLTWWVSQLRDAEERSGHAPLVEQYWWCYLLHRLFLRWVFWIAVISFVVHTISWLPMRVHVP